MTCVKCGKELSEVHPEAHHRRREDEYKYPLVDALLIGFVGGYGMFFDNETMRFMLCHSCAHGLIEANDWMAKVFNDHHYCVRESKDSTPASVFYDGIHEGCDTTYRHNHSTAPLVAGLS
jgi:hypothetical protein